MNPFKIGELVQIKEKYQKEYAIGMTDRVQQVVGIDEDIITLRSIAMYPADIYERYEGDGAYVYDYDLMRSIYVKQIN